jgi:hypothetical protein
MTSGEKDALAKSFMAATKRAAADASWGADCIGSREFECLIPEALVAQFSRNRLVP